MQRTVLETHVSMDISGKRAGADTPWRTDGDISFYVAWGPILQIGAEALDQALGAKLGDGMGEGLVDALLGRKSDDSKFQREVISRLDRIESKLDAVIAFLQSEFPALLDAAFEKGLSRDDRLALRAAQSGAGSSLFGLPEDRAELTLDQIVGLESANREVANLGEKLLLRGQGYYLAGVHAFACMLSIYSRLADSNPKKLKSIAYRAQRFLEIVSPWVDINIPNSYTATRNILDAEYAESQRVLGSLPAMIITSYFQPRADHDQYENWTAFYWAYYGLSSSGSIVHNFNGERGKLLFPRLPDPLDHPSIVKRIADENLVEYVKLVDWHAPPVYGPGDSAYNKYVAAGWAATTVQKAIDTNAAYRNRRDELDKIIDVIEQFLRSLNAISLLGAPE